MQKLYLHPPLLFPETYSSYIDSFNRHILSKKQIPIIVYLPSRRRVKRWASALSTCISIVLQLLCRPKPLVAKQHCCATSTGGLDVCSIAGLDISGTTSVNLYIMHFFFHIICVKVCRISNGYLLRYFGMLFGLSFVTSYIHFHFST